MRHRAHGETPGELSWHRAAVAFLSSLWNSAQALKGVGLPWGPELSLGDHSCAPERGETSADTQCGYLPCVRLSEMAKVQFNIKHTIVDE